MATFEPSAESSIRVCARCRQVLSANDSGRVPLWLATAAATSLAFVHAGMWVMEGLSKPYCSRCRAVIVPFIIGVMALVITVVVFGVTIWVKNIKRLE